MALSSWKMSRSCRAQINIGCKEKNVGKYKLLQLFPVEIPMYVCVSVCLQDDEKDLARWMAKWIREEDE